MPCEEIRRILSDGDRRTLRGRRVHSHLRSCPSCAAFAAAIDDRREQLQALAPPLAPVAMAGVLAHLAGATGSSHGSAGVGALAGSAAGKSAAGVLATKALVGAALVTGATIGVTHAVRSGGRSHHSVRHITTRRAPSSHAASTQPVTGSTREPPQPTARPAPGATSAGSSAAAPAPASGKSTGHEQGVGRGRGHATDGAEPRGRRVARGHTRGPQANSKEARSRRLEHAGKARGTNGANSRHAKVTSKPGTRAGTPPQPSHQKPEVFGSSAGGRSKP